MGIATVPWAVQGGCGKEQDHLPSFPTFLTQRPACTIQILQAVGVFLGWHMGGQSQAGAESCCCARSCVNACPVRQHGCAGRGLAGEGDVSPQNSHPPPACAERTQQPSPGAGTVRVTLKDKAVPITTHQEGTEIPSSEFFFSCLFPFSVSLNLAESTCCSPVRKGADVAPWRTEPRLSPGAGCRLPGAVVPLPSPFVASVVRGAGDERCMSHGSGAQQAPARQPDPPEAGRSSSERNSGKPGLC